MLVSYSIQMYRGPTDLYGLEDIILQGEFIMVEHLGCPLTKQWQNFYLICKVFCCLSGGKLDSTVWESDTLNRVHYLLLPNIPCIKTDTTYQYILWHEKRCILFH